MDSGRGAGFNSCASDLWEQMGGANKVLARKVNLFLIARRESSSMLSLILFQILLFSPLPALASQLVFAWFKVLLLE